MKKKDKDPTTRHEWLGTFKFFAKVKYPWLLMLGYLIFRLMYTKIYSAIPGDTAAVFAGDLSMKAITDLIMNYILIALLISFGNLASSFISQLAHKRVRGQLWGRMMRTKTDAFRGENPDTLLTAITTDVEGAYNNFSAIIFHTIPSIYGIFLSLDEIAQYELKLVYSLGLLIPFYIVYAVFYGRWSRKVTYKTQLRIGTLTGFLAERLKNLGMVKSYGTEEKEDETGKGVIQQLYDIYIQEGWLSAVGYCFYSAGDLISKAVVIIWGSLMLKNGEITVEGWLAFFMYVPMISHNLYMVTNAWVDIKTMQGFVVRLRGIMEAPLEVLSKGKHKFAAGDIHFDKVSFAYDEEPVVKDVSFTMKKGTVTAVVGSTGSGKTTLMKLIEQFHRPDSGKITLGGKDIGEYILSDYRSHIAYVAQDAEMYSGSFREVMTYGLHREVSDREIEKVAKQVGMYDFITAQPEGLDSHIAVWGNSLSGGQRQRLVLARELLKNSDLLLLDEPTSTLDPVSAKEIKDMIFREFKGKTIMLITHDLKLIAEASNILVMKEGKVDGFGKHEDLMEKSKHYSELIHEQSYQEVYGS